LAQARRRRGSRRRPASASARGSARKRAEARGRARRMGARAAGAALAAVVLAGNIAGLRPLEVAWAGVPAPRRLARPGPRAPALAPRGFCAPSVAPLTRSPALARALVARLGQAQAQEAQAQEVRQGERPRDQVLEAWRLLPSGRFRGTLNNGLVVEFEGELVGPADPGVVLGPGGARYVLGRAAPEAPAVDSAEAAAGASGGDAWPAPAQPVLAAAAAAVGAALVLLASGAVRLPVIGAPSPVDGPVTRTNVTIVETRRTLPDGSSAKIIDKTTRRERVVPGKAPVVSETTKRTEKVLRDERTKDRPALPAAVAPDAAPLAAP